MKVGEVGRKIYFNAQFDMSANTSLSAALTKPDGTTLTVTPTIGAVPVGSYVANEYATYDTQAGDIDQAGTWSAVLTYNDASPKIYISDRASFTVEAV